MRRSSILVLLALALMPVRADAQAPVTLDAVTNDSCANPTQLVGGRVYEGDTYLATDQFSSAGGRSSGSPDLVYRFTLNEPQQVSFNPMPPTGLNAYSWYSMVYIRTVCEDRNSQMHFDEIGRFVYGRMRINLPAGTYYAIFDGDIAPPPFDRGRFRFQFSHQPPPLGDTCDVPKPLEFDVPVYDNSSFNADDFRTSKVPSGGRDVVFTFTLNSPKTVMLDTEGSQYDTTLYLRTVCDDHTSEIAWGDIVPGGGPYGDKSFHARVKKALEPGTYYAILDGFSYDQYGQFLLNLTELD